MNRAVGHYRLDEASRDFFGSPVMHLVRRGSAVVGRFGRRGVITGSVKGAVLEAQWKARERSGWLRVRFDPTYRSFSGDYGIAPDGPAVGQCQAKAGK